MSKLAFFNAFLSQWLNAAAVDITSAVERTITDYQEEICRCKEENERLRRLLDFKPYVQLNKPDLQNLPLPLPKDGFTPEPQQHGEQELSPGVGQEDPEPTQIKVELDEFCGSSVEEDPFEELKTVNKDFLKVCVVSDCPSLSSLPVSSSAEGRDGGSLFSNITGAIKPEPKDGEDYIHYIDSEPSSPAACRENSVNNTSDHEGYSCGLPLPSGSKPKVLDRKWKKKQISHLEDAGPFCCRLCDRTFVSMYFLVNHQQKTHIAQSLENHYGVCEEMLDSKEKLTVHLQTHTEEKATSRWQMVTESNRQTIAQPPFHPETTEQETTAKGRRPRQQPTSKHTCHICGMPFPYNHNLKLHMRTHTGEKPFKCKICGKCYPYKGYMNVHMRLHTGEKPFQCRDCGKGFPTKQYLASHMMFHTGEKSYRCKDCGKGFNSKEDLDKHQPTHLEEKPFSCLQCGKCFKDVHHLTRHKLVHTGERPFTCDVCGRGFSIQSNLKVHQRVHTGEKPYHCKLCGKHFTSGRGLRYHLNALHNHGSAL